MPDTINGQPSAIADEPHNQGETVYVPYEQVTEA